MTLKERDAIEGYEEPDGPSYAPSFAAKFGVRDEGTCSACYCPCADHWGWIGNHEIFSCTRAQAKEIVRLRQELRERDSRLRGEFLGRDSGTPAVESRVDGDAA